MLGAIFVIAAMAVVYAMYLVFGSGKRKNYPPGPWGLPLIGQTFSMEWLRKERTFLQWARQYGPICQFSSLGGKGVVLSDPELIREAFGLPATTNRITNRARKMYYADYGLVFSSGVLWRETRRFTLHHLRDLGLGRSRMEDIIREQASAFINDIIAPCEGRPLFINQMRTAIANVLWGVVSGEQFSVNDTRAIDVMTSFEKIGHYERTFLLVALIPGVELLPGSWTGVEGAMEVFMTPIKQLFQPAIDAHEQTVNLTGEPRDYIDCLLQERNRNPELVTNKHMLRCIVDLFAAGIDTTAVTLHWSFCLLCLHPEVQQRVREEIAAVVGDDRCPAVVDRLNMPYTEAFLMEVHRVASVVPFGIEHVTSEEIQLGGYTIHRGSQVISSIMSVHQDEKFFPEPDKFKPERFLDAEGRVRPNRALMPFSVGRRACLGEALARAEVFIFLTALLQRFSLRFPDGFRHDLSVIEHKRFVRDIIPFQVVPERR